MQHHTLCGLQQDSRPDPWLPDLTAGQKTNTAAEQASHDGSDSLRSRSHVGHKCNAAGRLDIACGVTVSVSGKRLGLVPGLGHIACLHGRTYHW
ncbi:hypothetical protein NDU88_002664 [Pleurodeles waltl]|uniref:Uncharacterized protein n=1 Tax=Pleurodeles waltl TaxID=8319 RepID=A0AAV7NH60_PLEWA|nr:hypothetical protein NDU88_002664 [Pleurodeles waltl]